MRRMLSFVARLLPLDARGRRAVNEVLADWRHEREKTRTATRWLFVEARGIAAVFCVVVFVAGRETGDAWRSGLLASAALWFAVPYALLGLGGLVPFELGSETGLVFTAAGLCGFTAVFLPLSLFVSIQRHRAGSTPPGAVGLALVTFVVVLLTSGWITPALNQAYRELAYSARAGVGVIAPGLAELSIVELVEDTAFGRRTGATAMVLSRRLSLVFAAPAAVFLAWQVHARGWRHWWTVAIAVCAYVALIAAASSGRWPFWIELLQAWSIPVALLLLAAVLARPRRFTAEMPDARR